MGSEDILMKSVMCWRQVIELERISEDWRGRREGLYTIRGYVYSMFGVLVADRHDVVHDDERDRGRGSVSAGKDLAKIWLRSRIQIQF